MPKLSRRMLFGSAAAATSFVGAARAQAIPQEPGPQEPAKPATLSRASLEERRLAIPTAQPLPPAQVEGEDDSTIEGARRPRVRGQPAWDNIVKDFKSSYALLVGDPLLALADDNYLSDALGHTAMAVDAGFVFTPEPQDEFRDNMCELLLNDAASLLDRCIRDRSDYEEKAVRATNLGLEILDFLLTDKVHADEVLAGIYTVPFHQSSSEFRAQHSLENALNISQLCTGNIVGLNFTDAQINRQLSHAQFHGWVDHIAGYKYQHHGNFLSINWGGSENIIQAHSMAATFEQTDWSLFNQQASYQAQNAAYIGEHRASLARKAGYRKKSDFDHADADFKRRRTEIAQKLADLKIRIATSPGGAYNYAKKMEAIQQRVWRDLRDAIARIKVASRGLAIIYDYVVPLPQSIVGENVDPLKYAPIIDDCGIWVKDALSWLSRFAQNEQGYALALSVRSLVGEKEWKEGLINGVWETEVKPTHFLSEARVRLRGISASVFGAALHGAWDCTLRVPAHSIIVREDGTEKAVDQSKVPPLRLGRVYPRSIVLNPDVSGSITYFNVSPTGTWTVSMSEKSTDRESRIALGDIVIELFVSVKMRT